MSRLGARSLALTQLILLVGLVTSCAEPTSTPGILPTFTPRGLPTATPTPDGLPFIPTLTPVPLGQLPNTLTTYRLDVILDYVGHRTQVSQSVEVVNPGPDTWDSILFQIPTAIQSSAFILNSITLPSVDSVVNATYELSGYTLRVLIPDGVVSGAVARVTLNYGLAAEAVNADSRPPQGNVGYSENVIQFINWYPVLAPYQPGLGWLPMGAEATSPLPGDPIFTEVAAYELAVTAPENVIVVSGGLVSRVGERWKFSLKNARTVAIAASDQYESLMQTEGGVVISSYYLAEHAEAGRSALIAAAQSMALFNDRFGSYPYPTLAVAENAYFGSAAAGGVVLHNGPAYVDYTGNADSLLIASMPQAISRLWWGQVVTGDAFNQPWLNEALPMYAEYLFLETFYPELKSWYWESRVEYWQPEGLLGRRTSEFKDSEDYYRNLLRRGAQFMHGLRTEIGDAAFFGFLQDYYRNGAYRTVNAADFFNALRRHTDSNLEQLLTTYFIGQTMPTPAPTLTPAASLAPPGPPTPTPTVHIVLAGESLSLIAAQYGVTVEAIVRANGLTDPNSIYEGQQLIIPLP